MRVSRQTICRDKPCATRFGTAAPSPNSHRRINFASRTSALHSAHLFTIGPTVFLYDELKNAKSEEDIKDDRQAKAADIHVGFFALTLFNK